MRIRKPVVRRIFSNGMFCIDSISLSKCYRYIKIKNSRGGI